MTVVLGGCSAPVAAPAPMTSSAYGAVIDMSTPQGMRSRQTMDMLNSNWSLEPAGVKTLAAPSQVDDITYRLKWIWWDRPFKLTGIDIGAGQSTLHVTNSYGVNQDINLHVDKAGTVDRLEVSLRPPPVKSWADVDAQIAKSGARYSYQAAKIVDGKCVKVAGTNVDQPMPLASIMKLYVLLAVAHAVSAGTLSWDDKVTVTEEGKKLGSAGLDHLSPGAQVTIRDAAQQMISASDNMATDMLINKVGPTAVDQALVAAGHHDPASMTPFPTMHELFSIGWGEPDVRDQWKNGDKTQRTALLEQAKDRPYDPDPWRTHTPASSIGAEWYGTAADICREHVAVQTAAVGPAAPVRDIMSKVAGIDLDPAKWPYVGSKGGNLPGDVGFSWYAIDHTGQPWVMNFQLTWPEFRGQTAAQWLLSIAKQAFDLLPVQ
ncbi:serine hydrolase [Mycobacterium sp. OTB74]|uniref:serine hydrolase n=1 Tax=Mycobacterium sp. OTB74 TaxID=1853452 RepID=UPI0024768972|nr:serine hydrolase [Mycobacterium sp. OTB74]